MVCEDVTCLIYLYLGKYEFFIAFHCQENKAPSACYKALLLIYSAGCLICECDM